MHCTRPAFAFDTSPTFAALTYGTILLQLLFREHPEERKIRACRSNSRCTEAAFINKKWPARSSKRADRMLKGLSSFEQLFKSYAREDSGASTETILARS